MNKKSQLDAIILAEVLRLQRWAGGEHVPADRIFGLMNGFESVVDQESESFGISRDTQDKVENLLEDVEYGTQSTDGMAIKDRLRRDHVAESDAGRVMQLCRLQSRFVDSVNAIANGVGSVFAYITRRRQPEQNWFGSLHYIELVDCTEGVRKKLHAVFAPAIPRVGEYVTPENGPAMRVVGVDHVVASQGDDESVVHNILIPHVLLEMDDNDEVASNE
nr:hypothetical protein [Pirellula staleyi]